MDAVSWTGDVEVTLVILDHPDPRHDRTVGEMFVLFDEEKIVVVVRVGADVVDVFALKPERSGSGSCCFH
ncbi:hypothetical protein SDC9_206030 [bioreactor metagenome]|uniref:Uncharacterized protein n=1 Tax=bioreactor metagenome TaxID=1076179 RepID=A0A645J4F5_9ZZZZ